MRWLSSSCLLHADVSLLVLVPEGYYLVFQAVAIAHYPTDSILYTSSPIFLLLPTENCRRI